jgi:integrase
MAVSAMGRIRAREESGNLFIDFRYRGRRYREQTLLKDNAKNRKQLESLLQRIEAEIIVGQFDYAAFFPNSNNVAKFQASITPALSRSSTHTENSPVFSEFADQWLREMRVQWRKSHVRNIESILDSSIRPSFGESDIGTITKSDILNFRTKLAARKGRGPNGGGVAPKTVNNHMMVLRMILDEAAERYGFESPYKNIKPLKLQKTHIEPFSLREVDLIIDTVREDFRNYYIVRFYTGLRTGELNGLKWKYVDFENKEILIRETNISGETEYTKNDGSQREIPMFGPVFDALKNQLEVTKRHSEYVFCTNTGEPLDNCNVTNRVWYPLLRYLGLNKRRPYQTRHTAATLLLASGENPEWVARVLGHSSTEMLFKVYSRYIPNLTRMDGSAFERLLGSQCTTALSSEVHTTSETTNNPKETSND